MGSPIIYMRRKIYGDLQYELSKEHMEDPYDVFLQLQGVVTPALCLHKLRSPSKN